MEEEQIKSFKVVEGRLESNCKIITEQELKEMIKSFVSQSIHLNILLASGASLPAIPLMRNLFSKFKTRDYGKSSSSRSPIIPLDSTD